MKKFTLFLFIAFLSFRVLAQDTIPNADFERWTSNTGYSDPNGWTTPNATTVSYGGVAEVTQTDTAYTGNYAARLETRQLLVPHLDTSSIPGFVVLGSINILTRSITGGVPFTGRPDSLYGWCQYMPANLNDSALVYVMLTKWNTTENKRDTVGFGGTILFDSIKQWSLFNVAINYFSNQEAPDTIQLAVSSTFNFFVNPPLGSTFFVDDLTFSKDTSKVTGIKSVTNAGFSISCYPNPAKTNLNILISEPQTQMLIKVYDALGRNMLVAKNSGLITTLDVSSFSNGLYFYEVLDNNGQVLKTDKFTVTR